MLKIKHFMYAVLVSVCECKLCNANPLGMLVQIKTYTGPTLGYLKIYSVYSIFGKEWSNVEHI